MALTSRKRSWLPELRAQSVCVKVKFVKLRFDPDPERGSDTVRIEIRVLWSLDEIVVRVRRVGNSFDGIGET